MSATDQLAELPRLADIDDASFDPFALFNAANAHTEVSDPYPKFHELTAGGPVQPGDIRAAFGLQPYGLWDGLDSYMVFGHSAVTKTYLDAASFSSGIMMRVYAESFGQSINGMDAPEHTRYRRLFQEAFMPRVVAQWGAELVPGVVAGVIDRFADRGKADLVGDFTVHYPFEVIYAQLGLPPADSQTFYKLAVALMCIMMDPPHAIEASRKMGVYLEEMLKIRGASGAEDMIGMLARAEVDHERLPVDVAVSFLRQLLNAAGDTTYRATSSMLVGLLSNPEQLAAVQGDRSLVPQAVEEALRWEGPLTTLTRQTTRDVEIAGTVIPAGAKVDIIQGTANRDPSRYEDPDRFDIFRTAKRNLAFALGPHVCIGQHLAKMEMERALNALFDRLPNLRLDPDYAAPSIVGLNLRAPESIRVLFDPA